MTFDASVELDYIENDDTTMREKISDEQKYLI